uniref:telomeric repeat-binding factor 1-like n=1 Tax=Oncorhynchus gorbuscha TaxID=8017 RepID=UPI001EAEE92F|nr:telomeric repeat-binding factor 1-like [Oncorhynchus gorbuscha]
MEADPSNRTLTITSTTDENVCFSDVTTVVKRWMIDFSFVSLCQFFKEGKFEEFNQTISTLETIIDGTPHLNTEQRQKRQICGFLARIMHGKHLDVSFGRDERLSPLMSAVGVWASQEETVADLTLFQHITNLLYVQSVAHRHRLQPPAIATAFQPLAIATGLSSHQPSPPPLATAIATGL